MTTKRQIIQDAMTEIGLGDYAFDADPEKLQFALRRLDALFALWETKGVRVDYTPSADPSDLDQESGLAQDAIDAAVPALGLSLAPSYGKVPSMDTKAAAKAGFLALQAKSMLTVTMQPNAASVPAGAGNYYPFLTDGSE